MVKLKSRKARNMKTKTLTIIIASVALPVIGGLSGCETTPAQEMAVGGVSAQHIAATNPNLSYRQSKSLGAIGSLLGILSQQEAMKEAAREGKSEINVNVGTDHPNYQTIKTLQIYEIINLDTNEKILQEGDYWKYINKLEKTESYPKKGLKIFYPKKDGKRKWMILVRDDRGGYTKIERGEILR